MFKTWFGLARDAVLLGFETQRVIGLRLAKMAEGGPAAQVEAHQRMVMEKSAALAEAATTLATGGSPQTVVRHYRRRVKANERRLSRVKSKP